MEAREKAGPLVKTVTTYHCLGCPALRTEDWEFYGENDDRDSGTSAKCSAADGRHIASYWYEKDTAPAWCPAIASAT